MLYPFLPKSVDCDVLLKVALYMPYIETFGLKMGQLGGRGECRLRLVIKVI